MNHVAARELLWDGQLDTTHDAGVERAEGVLLSAYHGHRYGLARGIAWGGIFSLPIWSAVAVIVVR